MRYEDLCLKTDEGAQKILKFFRLQFHPQVYEYLKGHTRDDVKGFHPTRKNSKEIPFLWRDYYHQNFQELLDVQNACTKAMSLWGYELALNSSHMTSFNPLSNPPWEDMKIVADS